MIRKQQEIPINFADGLEQRYGVEAIDSREKALFNKLNDIGGNEENLLYRGIWWNDGDTSMQMYSKEHMEQEDW